MSHLAIRKALTRVSSARLRHFFHDLGPGLITGAADDDPSGISTYSVAGAAFGYGQLWTALFSFPLMAAVQLMCARLGMVTGLGLASVVRRRYSRTILWGACLLLENLATEIDGGAPQSNYNHEMMLVIDEGGRDSLFLRQDLWYEESGKVKQGRFWSLAKRLQESYWKRTHA